MKFEFSAGGIVYKKEERKYKFALILDSYGHWTFPKGHIEKNEKPEESALREVSEELGIKELKLQELIDKIDYWFKFEGVLIHKFVYFYLVEAFGQTKLSPQEAEVKEADWFSAKEAFELIGYKEDKKLLEKSLIILKLEI